MELIVRLRKKVQANHLLDHPFYQRWSAGQLSMDELQNYARQYWHYTLAFPTFVSAIHANSSDMVVRQALLENLIEEERGADNHPELWLRFCEALGLEREEVLASEPSEKTTRLIKVMKDLCRDGEVHEGLAALFSYESQVPSVSEAKIDGLRNFYAIERPEDVVFFAVHIEADVVHSKVSEDLLRSLCDTAAKEQQATAASSAALDALYGFLDGVTAEMAAAN